MQVRTPPAKVKLARLRNGQSAQTKKRAGISEKTDLQVTIYTDTRTFPLTGIPEPSIRVIHIRIFTKHFLIPVLSRGTRI